MSRRRIAAEITIALVIALVILLVAAASVSRLPFVYQGL